MKNYPTIENWDITSPEMVRYVINGFVHNHVHFPNGHHITTSPLIGKKVTSCVQPIPFIIWVQSILYMKLSSSNAKEHLLSVLPEIIDEEE